MNSYDAELNSTACSKVCTADENCEEAYKFEETLNDKEKLQLTIENEQLFNKLAQVDGNMQRIEKQMADIQRLQETFAEKVNPVSFLRH